MIEARIAIYLTLATVIIGFITAIIGLRDNRHKLADIHVLVNSNYTTINRRVDQLVAILHDNGIEVPPPPEPEQQALRSVVSGRGTRIARAKSPCGGTCACR